MKKVSFRVRNFDKEQFLTYDIDNEAELDEEVLDFLEDEEPKGIVPIIFEEGEEFDTFSYDITDKIRLCELSNQEINAEMVLMVMRGLVLSLLDMAEYRVPLSYLVLHRNYIYINSEYEVEFICIPLEEMQEEVDVNSFLRNFVASLRFESSENGDYVAKLLSYINNSAIFKLRNMVTLIEMLMDDMGIERPEESSADIYVDYQEVDESVDTEQEVQIDTVESILDELDRLDELDEEDEITEPEDVIKEEYETAEPEEVIEEDEIEEPEEVIEEEDELEEPEEVIEEEDELEEPEEVIEEEDEITEPEEVIEEEDEITEPEEVIEEDDELEEVDEEKTIKVFGKFSLKQEPVSEEVVEEDKTAEPEEVEEVKVAESEEVVEEVKVAESEEVVEEDKTAEPEEVVEEDKTAEPEEVVEEDKTAEPEEVVEEDKTAEQEEVVTVLEEKAEKEIEESDSEMKESKEGTDSLISNLKKKVVGVVDVVTSDTTTKETKKPMLKTKETPITGVVIPDELDEYLAEKELEEQARPIKHVELGLKMKKDVKVSRASVVKNNQEEHKIATEVAEAKPEGEIKVEETKTETEDNNSILNQALNTTGILKSTPVPKVNPYLIRVNTEERIMITKQTFKIGKAGMGVDYTVKGNGAVSRVHAIITTKDDIYYIKDNKSTNRTFVNGKALAEGENEELVDDCKIVLGDEEFIFKFR